MPSRYRRHVSLLVAQCLCTKVEFRQGQMRRWFQTESYATVGLSKLTFFVNQSVNSLLDVGNLRSEPLGKLSNGLVDERLMLDCLSRFEDPNK